MCFFAGIGKHVSVQPPAALGQNETLRMVQAAQYYPALLSVQKQIFVDFLSPLSAENSAGSSQELL
jgi:hypothetical protein